MLTWVRSCSRFKISMDFQKFGRYAPTLAWKLRCQPSTALFVLESLVVHVPEAKFEEWYSAMATTTKSTHVGVLEVTNQNLFWGVFVLGVFVLGVFVLIPSAMTGFNFR